MQTLYLCPALETRLVLSTCILRMGTSDSIWLVVRSLISIADKSQLPSRSSRTLNVPPAVYSTFRQEPATAQYQCLSHTPPSVLCSTSTPRHRMHLSPWSSTTGPLRESSAFRHQMREHCSSVMRRYATLRGGGVPATSSLHKAVQLQSGEPRLGVSLRLGRRWGGPCS